MCSTPEVGDNGAPVALSSVASGASDGSEASVLRPTLSWATLVSSIAHLHHPQIGLGLRPLENWTW